MAGTFLANGHPVVILFDSGASHSFISALCVFRNNLECERTEDEYFIQSPGGRLLNHAIVRNLPLDLNGDTYLASPLVLHHQGIDLILGVDWMNQHGAVIDTSTRTISLNAPDSTRCIVLSLPEHPVPSGSVCTLEVECGIELAGPLAFLGEMPWPATIETRLTGLRCLRDGRSVDPLRLRRPIILRPRNILLLHWSNDHLLLPLGQESRPERCLISHPGTLGSISRGSNCSLSLSLLNMMKTKVFFHGNSIVN